MVSRALSDGVGGKCSDRDGDRLGLKHTDTLERSPLEHMCRPGLGEFPSRLEDAVGGFQGIAPVGVVALTDAEGHGESRVRRRVVGVGQYDDEQLFHDCPSSGCQRGIPPYEL